MKITITGSLGNIGQHLVKILIAAGNDVTVISSSSDRKKTIEEMGAKASIGSITDTVFLTKSFSGSDSVFVMTPPNLGGQNIIENTIDAGKSYRQAIVDSGVKRVVMLSSIGAEFEDGTGPIKGLYHIENLYHNLKGVSVTYLRAGYFYTNFFNDIPLIKNAGILGSNFPSNTKVPLVHPADIAKAAAEELQSIAGGNNIRYVVSDYVTALEIAHSLGKAISKPALNWVEFTDEQSLDGMKAAGLPAEMANLYVEMGTAIRKGKLQSDFESQGKPIDGNIKLADFSSEFADRF